MTTLYVSSDRPVDPLTIAVSRAMDNVARHLKLPYFLAGAMARDIILTNVYGIDTGLATSDVDFAIAVANWDQFDLLKTKLIETGRFKSSERIAHRIYYSNHDGKAGYPVDVIPFGGVENPANSIAWPRDRGVIMNVVGYAEILQTALSVEIAAGFAVPIASLPGLALLKLFAWQDRHAETTKDAQDLVVLCRNYVDAGNEDRIYGDEISLLEGVGFDMDLASPCLLGKDVRRIASSATLEQARVLLTDTKMTERLVTHMAARFKGADDSIAMAEGILEQFRAGLTEEEV